jgi:hypothetical protein
VSADEDAGRKARAEAFRKAIEIENRAAGRAAGTQSQDAGKQARADAFRKAIEFENRAADRAAGTHGEDTETAAAKHSGADTSERITDLDSARKHIAALEAGRDTDRQVGELQARVNRLEELLSRTEGHETDVDGNLRGEAHGGQLERGRGDERARADGKDASPADAVRPQDANDVGVVRREETDEHTDRKQHADRTLLSRMAAWIEKAGDAIVRVASLRNFGVGAYFVGTVLSAVSVSHGDLGQAADFGFGGAAAAYSFFRDLYQEKAEH